MNRYLIFLIMYFLSMTRAMAALDFEDHAFPEYVTSARALAMGNAYLSKVDDPWSAFYNPAGLGTVRQPQFHLFNMSLEGSNGFFDVTGGPVTDLPGNIKDTYDGEKLRGMLAKDQGKLVHSRASFFPNITLRGMTLGYFFSQRNRAIINDDVENNFELNERRDQGPVFSLNGSLFGGIFKVGATAIYLTRRELYKSVGPTEDFVIENNDYKSGRGLQLIAGSRLTLPLTYLPTLSAVLRNATNNDFEGAGSGGPPDRIKSTVDLGFSITPQIGKMTRLHFEANLKDVNNSYETNAKRRAAFGTELDFNRRIFLRAGYGDGWGSGGIGVRSRSFIMDISTYAVDRSREGFREEEDRRWVLSLSSGF